uniref:TIR domain-containing protein n=1 Tax=Strigamia maritima TaxID=126957 RepID=T1IJA9_STRMM
MFGTYFLTTLFSIWMCAKTLQLPPPSYPDETYLGLPFRIRRALPPPPSFRPGRSVNSDCSIHISCEEPGNACALLDDKCSCSVSLFTCEDWSNKTFTFKRPMSYLGRSDLIINGENSGIAFEFIDWFVPNFLRHSASKFPRLDISHFCESIADSIEKHSLSLEKLDLSFNKFTRVPKFSHDLDSLFKYDLSNNNIANVLNTDFNNTSKLEQLNLSNNNLSSVAEDLLFHLNRLEELDLSHNQISVLPVGLLKDSRLKSFNMKLEELYLQSNNIREINLAGLLEYKIEYLTFLENTNEVDLSFKNFRNLNAVFSRDFSRFDLSYNPLVCDCRLNDFIQYLRSNQNASHFAFHTENIFCTKPTDMYGVFLQTINQHLICDYQENCPEYCYCYVDDVDHIFYVWIDCINSGLTHFPKINSYGSSVSINLSLAHNHISSLPLNKNDPIWSQITVLDLSYNQLKSLTNVISIFPNLTELNLRNNSLTGFDDKITSLSHLEKLRLEDNPWKCDCEMVKSALKLARIEQNLIFCQKDSNELQSFVEFYKNCNSSFNVLWIVLPIIICICVIIISVIAVLFIKYKAEILYYMFSRGICLRFVSEEMDFDKVYDAFVSYSGEDEDWIVDFLVPGLEMGIPSYKLCLHSRDWRAGEFITDQIVKSVESSRRTIIVLTDNYLKSNWSRLEFDVAYQQALKDQVRRVIAVVPDEVPDLSKIDKEFKSFITLTTYVEAKKPYFWRKLRASMPRTNNTRKASNTRKSVYLKPSVNENTV